MLLRRRRYLRYLGDLREIALHEDCAVHACVLMTNHVHLLMTPAATGQVARVMQALGRRYVRYINDRYRRTGTLWEGRYKACLVDHETYLLHCYRYIELNPVRARMVVDAGDYPWSSFASNALGQPNPLLRPHASSPSALACPNAVRPIAHWSCRASPRKISTASAGPATPTRLRLRSLPRGHRDPTAAARRTGKNRPATEAEAHRGKCTLTPVCFGLQAAAPMRILKLLTGNGSQFTDRFTGRGRQPSGQHAFDQLCVRLGIAHRLIPPRHPQTNGMVERFNGRISDILATTRSARARICRRR